MPNFASAGEGPAIHAFMALDVDRDKRGHDAVNLSQNTGQQRWQAQITE
jgi:hypothetical protein